ncbi:hypothetical protein T439DRAFT_322531 [Meredithblackwellia eburnea MCA 4105]
MPRSSATTPHTIVSFPPSAPPITNTGKKRKRLKEVWETIKREAGNNNSESSGGSQPSSRGDRDGDRPTGRELGWAETWGSVNLGDERASSKNTSSKAKARSNKDRPSTRSRSTSFTPSNLESESDDVGTTSAGATRDGRSRSASGDERASKTEEPIVDQVVVENTLPPSQWRIGNGDHTSSAAGDDSGRFPLHLPHLAGSGVGGRKSGEMDVINESPADRALSIHSRRSRRSSYFGLNLKRSKSNLHQGSHGNPFAGAADEQPWWKDLKSAREWMPVRKMEKFVLGRCWGVLYEFFAARYPDRQTELAFQKEQWWSQKSVTIVGSFFVLANFMLQIGLQQGTSSDWNRVANYVVGPVLALFLIILSIFNGPRKWPGIWQAIVFFCTWVGSCGFVIDLHLCGYYATEECGKRDFLATMLYASAFPFVGLFALGQKRLLTFAGCLVWITISSALVVPQNLNFLRDMLPWGVFQAFVLYFHYAREVSDRRTFTLRMELKVQFKAKQRAQVNEKKTLDAKNSFANYIFHEVRVPLNTALLAVQNLKANRVFDKHSELSVEYSALESSLAMMKTVLNDVLDHARMERGGFSSVNRPFSFHRVVRGVIGPLKLETAAKGLHLVTSLDPRLDEVAVRASTKAGVEFNAAGIKEGDGVVVGDEVRIRQVITNLTSNATKFSNSGGTITVTTRLVHPAVDSPAGTSATSGSVTLTGEKPATDAVDAMEKGDALDDLVAEHETDSNTLIVRIEVQDTGVGVRPQDMEGGKMFNAYHQNHQTLLQGGKGTGLGLSLVRQIVTLSGGRLGVKSQVGIGSTFWVEFPLGTLSPETAEADVDFAKLHSIEDELATPQTMEDGSEYNFGSTPVSPSSSSVKKPEEALLSRKVSDPKELVRGDERIVASSSPLREDQVEVTEIKGTSPTGSHLTVPPPTSPRVVATPPTSAPGSPRVGLDFANGPLRALVVDDDALTRKLMGRMISRLGCDVASAENGEIALNMIIAKREQDEASEFQLKSKNFDIIFLDNQMPVMTGIQLAARLKAQKRDDLVVGVTANALLEDQEEFVAAGASTVLTKPVKEGDLKRLLIIADQKRTATASVPHLPSVEGDGRAGPSSTAPVSLVIPPTKTLS